MTTAAASLAHADPAEWETTRTRGENGHAELTAAGLGDALLALFDKAVRGLDETRIRTLTADIIAEARDAGDEQRIKDLFLLAFHTRWCRGGKGERKLFYQLLAVLYERYPAVVLALVDLIPAYGYWKDLLSLLVECHRDGVDYGPLAARVWAAYAAQIEADAAELKAAEHDRRAPKLSLAAKFAPSEGGHHSRALKADREICKLLFPTLVGDRMVAGREAAWPTARAKYRRILSSLRRALAVPEVRMCAQQWAEIEFGKVSSLCLDRHKRAFLNEGKANRHEDTPDRVACRENLLSLITEKGVAALKGKQLFPHELVKQVLEPKRGFCGFGAGGECGHGLSDAVCAVLNVQWEAIRAGLLEQVEARQAELALAASEVDRVDVLRTASDICPGAAALNVAADVAMLSAVATGARRPVGLSRIVPMADVSGSMTGTPMHVAIALGILVSEVTHSAFRDKVLTFDTNPTWHDLSMHTTFVDKVQSLRGAEWGGSTDFAKAMAKIADLVRAERLEQCDVPDLLVISDMQFDEAISHGPSFGYLPFGYTGSGSERSGAPQDRGWSTAHENITRMFAQLGTELHGHPLQPPNIIFWNVRADTVGFPAAADDKGVMLLSGFSPALMKFILSGEMEEERVTLDAEGAVVKTRTQLDPRETLRRVLNDSGLDAVRAVLDAVDPAALPGASWLPPL